jgi:hypothetical protein
MTIKSYNIKLIICVYYFYEQFNLAITIREDCIQVGITNKVNSSAATTAASTNAVHR